MLTPMDGRHEHRSILELGWAFARSPRKETCCALLVGTALQVRNEWIFDPFLEYHVHAVAGWECGQEPLAFLESVGAFDD